MVVNSSELTANLTKFYDFQGKSALCVGAGGLARPAVERCVEGGCHRPRRRGSPQVPDRLRTEWAGIPIRFVSHKFETAKPRGDVGYFEFCMHQMQSPRRVFEHVRSIAKDIVAIDHLPGSNWVYCWAGEDTVLRSTNALESFGIRRRQTLAAGQRFEEGQALAARLSGEGEESRRRVSEVKGSKDVLVRMD